MASTVERSLTYTNETAISLIIQMLNEQRSSSRFCDVVLKVANDNIYAHSNVLAAASPYFCSFLGRGQDNPRAFSQRLPQVIEIHIDGSDGSLGYGEAVRRVVEYMYTTQIVLSSSIYTQILEIAKIMQMEAIVGFCEKFQSIDSAQTSNESSDGQTMQTNSPPDSTSVKNDTDDTNMPALASEIPNIMDREKNYKCTKCPYSTDTEYHFDRHQKAHIPKGDVSQTKLDDAIKPNVVTQEKESPIKKMNSVQQRSKRVRKSTMVKKEAETEDFTSFDNEDLGSDTESARDPDYKCENDENNDDFTVSHRSNRKRKLTMKMKALQKKQNIKIKMQQATVQSMSMKEASQTEGSASNRQKNFQCSKCPYTTDTKYHYDRHSQAHEATNKRYKCDECEYTAGKFRELSKHKDQHYHDRQQCSICFYKAESEESFTDHMAKHKVANPYFCSTCGVTFSNKTKLQLHLPKHSIDQPYVCQLCNRGFKWKHALKNHMITHSDSKDHLCDVCGFATAHKSQLKAHRLIHTGETYKCDVCPFQATKKQNLKYHMLTHTHEKPHQCEVCGQAFSLHKNMRRHMLLHSNERPYKCDQCSFTAVRNDKLKEHQLKQHGLGESPKRRHRLSDYHNSLVPAEDTNLVQIQVQEKEENGENMNLMVPIATIENLPGDVVQIESQPGEVVEQGSVEAEEATHVIIEGDQSFPVTLTRVSENGPEVTYQFVSEVE